MPPSFYCKPRWIKAGGRSTGHSLAPSTQIQFMNNQSKKCLSEQHCGMSGPFQSPSLFETEPPLGGGRQADVVGKPRVRWLMEQHRPLLPLRLHSLSCNDPCRRRSGKPEKAGDGKHHRP